MKKIIAIVGFLGLFASQTITSSAAYFNTTPVVRCETQITKTLQIGSENNDVYVLQQMLVNAGFLQANPNGYFGYQTAQAVRAFQTNNGIRPTGTVGESTRNAVNERLCDTDLIDNNQSSDYSYDSYGYSANTTYVNQNDPFVQVITPPVSTPTVYATPQNLSVSTTIAPSITPSYSSPIASQFVLSPSLPSSSQIAGSGIIYSPSIGYTYGVVPQSGSVTVSSPVAGNIYNEGDTVFVQWTTNNIQVSPFSILLESNITGQSKVVAVTSGTSYSFVLTKALLDAVCPGACDNNQQGSFRVVVTMPTTDIAGNTSTLRAAVAPITIHRPFTVGQVTISASKTPVNSGEVFKLYINIPRASSWNAGFSGNYVVKLKATCPSSVQASIAGVPCGQEFVVPFTNNASQQEIPVVITNTTWYKQNVTFQLTVTDLLGQTIGVGQTTVSSNGTPFSW